MHEHHIDNVLRVLSPLLGDKQEEAKHILLGYWSDDRMAIVWDTSDVISSCEDFGMTLSGEDAETVLQTVFNDYDPSYGINRETFYQAACDLMRERESA